MRDTLPSWIIGPRSSLFVTESKALEYYPAVPASIPKLGYRNELIEVLMLVREGGDLSAPQLFSEDCRYSYSDHAGGAQT